MKRSSSRSSTRVLRQVLGMLSTEEQLVCLWKRAGYSSREIAKYQGRSVTSVDAVFGRAKTKLRRLMQDIGATPQRITNKKAKKR